MKLWLFVVAVAGLLSCSVTNASMPDEDDLTGLSQTLLVETGYFEVDKRFSEEMLLEVSNEPEEPEAATTVDFDIDAVYLWVDSSNPKQEAARNEATSKGRAQSVASDGAATKRFQRHPNGFKYSVTSLVNNAPWLRKVHVVMSDLDTPPQWLVQSPKVVLHNQSQIFPNSQHLPTFNSFAIECWLHKVPDMSEHFLYFNDDMFIAKPVPPTLFFTTAGAARLWPDMGMGRITKKGNHEDAYWGTIRRSNEALMSSKYGHDITNMKYGLYPPEHQARALRKSIFEEAHVTFADQISRTSAQPFRSTTDVWTVHLALQLGLYTKEVVLSSHKREGPFLFGMLTGNHASNDQLFHRLTTSSHKLLCINRDTDSEELDRKMDETMQKVLGDAIKTPAVAAQPPISPPSPEQKQQKLQQQQQPALKAAATKLISKVKKVEIKPATATTAPSVARNSDPNNEKLSVVGEKIVNNKLNKTPSSQLMSLQPVSPSFPVKTKTVGKTTTTSVVSDSTTQQQQQATNNNAATEMLTKEFKRFSSPSA